MSETSPKFYEFMRPIVIFVINHFYNPEYINKDVVPSSGGAVLAGNHKFYFDPLLCDIVTPRCVYSMCWYAYYDIAPKFFKSLGTIRVAPKGKALDDAIEHLKEGHLINIFPEGEMNKTEEILLPFKRGAVTMAQATNVPVIPFVIVGKWKFKSKDLKIIFGEPLNLTNMSFEEGNSILYNTIKDMLIKYRV